MVVVGSNLKLFTVPNDDDIEFAFISWKGPIASPDAPVNAGPLRDAGWDGPSCLYMLVYLALATGMRQGEILGLQWESVDTKNGFISVCGTLTKDENGKLVVRETKGKRNRRVDIGPAPAKMLEDHHKRQHPLSLWVFPDSDGNPMRKDNFMYRQFRPLVKSAGLERLRFHDLRHTRATLGLAAGENVKVIQEMLGNASAKTTLDVYAQAVPSLQREAAARMDAILGAYGGTFWGTRAKNDEPKSLEVS